MNKNSYTKNTTNPPNLDQKYYLKGNSFSEFRQDFKKILKLIGEYKLTEIFDLLEPRSWKHEEIFHLIAKLSFKKPPDKGWSIEANPSEEKEVA